MPPPADPLRERGRRPREPRSGIDRAWLWRILLVVLVVAFVVLIAKAGLMAFGGAGRRIDVHSGGETRYSSAVAGFVRHGRRPGAYRAGEVAMLE